MADPDPKAGAAGPAKSERKVAAPLDPRLELGLQRAMDLGERAFAVILFAFFLTGLVGVLAVRPWDSLLLVSNALMVIFIVFRRRAQVVSTRPFDWLVALLGTAAPLLYRPGGHPVMAASTAGALMLPGILIVIWAKLTLRRSFGLIAANRGVVASGPYSFVRHPMYAGYLLVDSGFVLINPTGWNLAIFAADVALQIVRVLAEEKVLAADPIYAQFKARVRFRLAPLLF